MGFFVFVVKGVVIDMGFFRGYFFGGLYIFGKGERVGVIVKDNRSFVVI